MCRKGPATDNLRVQFASSISRAVLSPWSLATRAARPSQHSASWQAAKVRGLTRPKGISHLLRNAKGLIRMNGLSVSKLQRSQVFGLFATELPSLLSNVTRTQLKKPHGGKNQRAHQTEKLIRPPTLQQLRDYSASSKSDAKPDASSGK